MQNFAEKFVADNPQVSFFFTYPILKTTLGLFQLILFFSTPLSPCIFFSGNPPVFFRRPPPLFLIFVSTPQVLKYNSRYRIMKIAH